MKVALIAGKMVGGGVESVLMNLNKFIDKDRFEVDILVDEDSKVVPEKEIEESGVKLIYVPPYQSIITYLCALRKLFLENNYDIVHANISTLNVFPLAVAYLCRVRVRIYHNHNLISPNAGKLKNFTKWILSIFANVFPNYRVAPTFKTGKWVFKNKKFSVIENGIESKKFIFSEENRKNIRSKLKVDEDTILLGSFGRMVQSKNILFIVKVLEYLMINDASKYKLLLIGSGPNKDDLKQYVRSHPRLTKNVIFIPSQKNISKYYSALDVYLFPSTAEAFGIAAIEAQTNGLATLVSDGVPDESKVSDVLFKKFDSYNVEVWGKYILKMKNFNMNFRKQMSLEMENMVFNSKDMVNEIEELYIKAYEERG
ncbi:glycosyltransferase [Pediococcus stilesii]|uniref:Glycosyl transferase 4 n=1 Tax=Pediococcus stilesii TaxID=331679 RepID=A0A0R2L775_9LACO|nr:glycosyltransferase [Pediococcus stilesii]KRN94733.1 glycosyl transferase 4 [Pediococcus stilesii]